MRNHNSSKTSECTNPPGLPGSAGEASPPRAFAHKRKVLKRSKMPNAVHTFARRAPEGRNQLTGTQGGSLHTGTLSRRKKKSAKNLLGFF